jgi:hypothetical protein
MGDMIKTSKEILLSFFHLKGLAPHFSESLQRWVTQLAQLYLYRQPGEADEPHKPGARTKRRKAVQRAGGLIHEICCAKL